MAKNPGFKFYPGDYLRDTQCLTPYAQVAYDRIMCEHLRNISNHMINICVSKERLNFFTKRLNDSDKEDLLQTLIENKGTFQIEWVAESIFKAVVYSESRGKNKKGKTFKNKENHMISYVNHMDKDKDKDNIKDSDNDKKAVVFPFESEKFLKFWDLWKTYKKEEHRFNYKSIISEQAALKKLSNMAETENEAIEILESSMANGYIGFFKLNKSQSNGKQTAKDRFIHFENLKR